MNHKQIQKTIIAGLIFLLIWAYAAFVTLLKFVSIIGFDAYMKYMMNGGIAAIPGLIGLALVLKGVGRILDEKMNTRKRKEK